MRTARRSDKVCFECEMAEIQTGGEKVRGKREGEERPNPWLKFAGEDDLPNRRVGNMNAHLDTDGCKKLSCCTSQS